jgi:hypothetical protein
VKTNTQTPTQAPSAVISLADWVTSHRKEYDRKLTVSYKLDCHARANKLFALNYHFQYVTDYASAQRARSEESGVA